MIPDAEIPRGYDPGLGTWCLLIPAGVRRQAANLPRPRSIRAAPGRRLDLEYPCGTTISVVPSLDPRLLDTHADLEIGRTSYTWPASN